MKKFKWNEDKNKIIKEERGVSFEEILDSTFLGAEQHRTRKNQIVLLYEYKEYIWVVPCIIEDDYIFLKTIIPSRKYTKIFKAKEVKNEKREINKRRKRN
jgi:uncharacterized DUF497 family protein